MLRTPSGGCRRLFGAPVVNLIADFFKKSGAGTVGQVRLKSAA
jgi:hypothetical protein